MHAIRLLALLVFAALTPPMAMAAPLRCPETPEGGACVWGRVEGFEADRLQIQGLRVQLLGIAAPGRRDLCGSKTAKAEFDCGRAARKRMGELVAKGAACEIMDAASDTLYGRCRVAEGDLSRLLVAAGVARATKDGPYEAEQAAALAGQRGLWAPDIIPPKDWETIRRRHEKE